MKNASTKLAPLLLLVASTAIIAKVPADALDYYVCQSRNDAMQCSNCQLEAEIKLSYLVNVAAQKVIRNAYFDRTAEPQALEECTVIDRTNWICGEGRVDDEPIRGPAGLLTTSSYSKTGMQNGRVYSILEQESDRINADNSITRLSRENLYWCAK
jgi:hypothetical protein